MKDIRMIKICSMIILFLSATTSYANWSTSSGEVTSVYSHDGSHVIRTTLTDDVCTAGNFWWPVDDSDAKDMFSIVLVSLTSGMKISVVYNTSDLDCKHGSSTKITHMRITK